jgi:formylglycine-generating enzyme required for sulfatase activity
MKKTTINNLLRIVIATFFFTGIAAQANAADDVATPESIFWLAAQKKNTRDAYDAYLAQYPDGNFATIAQKGIAKLQRDQVVREENAEWKVLQDLEIVKPIQQFLDKYPTGTNMVAAKAKITAIRKMETEFKPGQAFKGCATCPEMVIVPAGSFIMGEVKNAHYVTFAIPFAIGKKEVTQREWIALMGSNPSKFKECGVNCPVDNVSWNDAREFIRRLNIKTGKEYRLPSESEWEYSCRAGAKQEFCGSDDVDSIAWFGAYSTGKLGSARTTKPVATKKANAWGLFDMSGNVAEWTEDGYHEDFAGAPTDGAVWQGDGNGYVLRGGSWEGNSEQVRAAYRDFDAPSNRDVTYGFRVARKFP